MRIVEKSKYKSIMYTRGVLRDGYIQMSLSNIKVKHSVMKTDIAAAIIDQLHHSLDGFTCSVIAFKVAEGVVAIWVFTFRVVDGQANWHRRILRPWANGHCFKIKINRFHSRGGGTHRSSASFQKPLHGFPPIILSTLDCLQLQGRHQLLR